MRFKLLYIFGSDVGVSEAFAVVSKQLSKFHLHIISGLNFLFVIKNGTQK